MASWKDGAAYAPTERPDGFASPVADPLPVAPPWAPPTEGPMAHPEDFRATAQPPLTDLGHTVTVGRDPREEFEVSSMAMTATPGIGSLRNPRDAFSLSTSTAPGYAPPAPVGEPLPGPPPAGAGHPGPFPTAPPGTWPAPRPSNGGPIQGPPQQGAPPAAPKQPQSESTRSLCWIAAAMCGFGILFAGAAPLLLIVAGSLGLRTTERTSQLGLAALIVGCASVIFQLLDGSLGEGGPLLMLFSLAAGVWFVVGAVRRGPSGP